MGISTISIGKVKFNWRGNWAINTAYVKDDVVKYGPNSYIITTSHTSSTTFAANIAKTQLMVEGITWEDVYNPATLYQVNDIVSYGGAIYVCIQETTGRAPAGSSAYWDRLVGGLEFEGAWSVSTAYQKGDIVRYGGYTYTASQDSVGDNPATATGYWSILNKGLNYQGAYDNTTVYAPGHTVTYGGNQYVIKEGVVSVAGTDPTNNTYWEVVVKGYVYAGTYVNSTTYLPGQLVNYGGRIYAALVKIVQSSPILPTNSDYWFLFSDGTRWRGDWSTGDAYVIGDIVRWGGWNYICIAAATGNVQRPNNVDYWQIQLKGINWEGDWVGTTSYQPGDTVKYGARIYTCILEAVYSGSPIPVTNNTYWQLLNDGQEWTGVWGSGDDYKIGDIVRHGARSYICVQGYEGDNSNTYNPENTSYWAILNKGLDWKGAWSTTTTYKLDDVVEYSGSSYVCIQAHTDDGSTNTTPNTATTYWQSLAQGDSTLPLTTTGDMIYRNAGGATTRLPIGGNGAYLVVNNGIPSWGVQAPDRNYYVSTTGSDSNDGKTVATAWRTIQYAATQTFNVGQCKISILAGTYNELTPIRVGRSVVIEGDGLGAVTISPNTTTDNGYGVGISKDGSTPNANSNVFHVNNGARIRNIVFRGFTNGAVCVSLDPGYGPNDTSVWIVSQSPYVQNCTSFTDGGTGMIVDGALHNGGYKSIVANDWTQINSDGFGIIVKNDGRSELVSCFTYYCTIGYLCESGGKIRAVGGNNSYGTFGSVARGFSQAETPLVGFLQLQDETINSIQTLTSTDNLHVFTSYRDFYGNIYCVGHTNPTGSDTTSTWSNTTSRPVIVKYDSAGGIDWIYSYDGAPGAIHSVLELEDNIYAGGVVYSGGTNKGFILKVSLAGEIQWQKVLSDTNEILDLTSDNTSYIYAVGNHNTYGASVIKVQPSGIVTWSRVLDYNDSSINTLSATSVCYAGTPTTSTDSYANEGDALAQDNLYIAARNTNTNEQFVIRMTNNGALVTAYNYGVQMVINKLRLDTGNGDGIYMMAAGYYDPAGAATRNPALMRLAVTGAVAWQKQIVSTNNGEWKDVLPFGDDVYVAGYLNDTDSTQIYNRGMLARFTSTGNESWVYVTEEASQNVWFNAVALDGVNVIAGGNYLRSSVVMNVQRDIVSGIGTVTSGNWTFNNLTPTVANATLSARAIQTIYAQTISLSLSDINLILNQSPGITRTVRATRPGFAGIGRGINFTVNGVTREPKRGSVVQIYNDDETYFLIDVGAYLPPTITPGNNPNARALLTANKTFIQDEIVAYINFTYPGFVYNQALCRRDIGLFVDALDHDLDYATNGETVDGAISYYNSASSLIAITTQLTETVAGFNRFKAVVLAVIQKNTVTRTTGNTTVQITSGSAGEAGAVTLAGSNVDTIIDIIQAGEAVAPTKIGYGTVEISLDPAIPSNKVPTDSTRVIFREAYSQVRMTGHDFLDIGSGGFATTNYPVIIASDYVQQPDQLKETVSENGGRVFYVTTDQDGNFRVGDYFKVEQATGRSTINAQEFNLSGLNELQLGSITAGRQGATVNEFSTDGTLSGNSDTAVPTERAVKTYVDDSILLAIGAATTLVVGDAPFETKVEVTGSGLNTDTVTIDIAGTETLVVDNTTLTFKPSGTTRFAASEYYMRVPSGTNAQRPGSPVAGFLRFNIDLNAFEGWDGTQWSGIGGGNPWTTKTANYTAINNDRLFVNTSTGAITITLPANPATGDSIRFIDLAGTFATNNLTVSRNNRLINGVADNLVVAQNNAGFQLVYSGSSYGWKLLEL